MEANGYNIGAEWDHCMLGDFKWLWHHTPTFETYEAELQFQTQIMCNGAQGTRALLSLSLSLVDEPTKVHAHTHTHTHEMQECERV